MAALVAKVTGELLLAVAGGEPISLGHVTIPITAEASPTKSGDLVLKAKPDMSEVRQFVEAVFWSDKPKTAGELSHDDFAYAIEQERKRQVEKGYDAKHDDEHGLEHLLFWAQECARRGEKVKSWALVEAARELIARSAS